jgi:signal transduction histidine kinase/integral membrane sensor domain MASE1
MIQLNRSTRPLLQIIFLALAYCVTGKLAASLLGLVKAEASPVWPPAGIALAALLLGGRQMWPGIALGSVLLNSTAGVGIPSPVIATAALSVTLQALVGESVLKRIGFSTKLERLEDVLGLVAGAAIGSTFLGSSIGNLGACVFGWAQWSSFSRSWWTTWLGDGMGVLIVTPVLLSLSHAVKSCKFQLKRNYISRRYISTNFPYLIVNSSEVAIWLTLLLTVSWLVFGSKTEMVSSLYPLEYLPFPLVVWAALRFGPPGAILAYSIVSCIAILGAVQGGGPFLAKSDNLKQAVLFLQAFTGTIAIVALMLAAAVAERQQALIEVRRTAALLRAREASLANAQRIAQLGNWDLPCQELAFPDHFELSEGQPKSDLELHWSDELYRLLGLTPGTVKPSPEVFLQSVHPDDRTLVARSQCQAMFESKPYCIDYRIVLPDGSERTVCEQSAINSDAIAATVQDITERSRAASALRASAERDRLLSEMALRIRQSLDLQEILNTTAAEVRQFFKADRTFIGMMQAEGTALARPASGKIVAESVNPGYRSILGWEIADENFLNNLRTFYANNRIRCVSDTANTESCVALANFYSYYQISATLNVPIVLGDELFGLLAVNQCSGPRQWQEFEIDLLEKLATQVAIALQQAQLLQQVKALNANLESQVQERTGQLQQKMYELQESNRLKDLFLHAVSHNLRTPVMGMLILLKNLLNKSAGDSQATVSVARSILQRIVEGSEHQLDMVNALLDAHSSEVKGIAINPLALQLRSITSDVIAHLAPLVDKNQATLSQEIPDDLPLVNADCKHLYRVFKNLLNNAIKHNPPGVNITLKAERSTIEIKHNIVGAARFLASTNHPVSSCISNLRLPSGINTQTIDANWELPTSAIEISAKSREIAAKFQIDGTCGLPRYRGQIGHSGGEIPARQTVPAVRCSIIDDGVGISEKQRESLFEFYVQDPESRQLTGLSLGLYLCKQIVKAHGGEIGVESTPGGGSTFWFSLPAVDRTDPPPSV